MIEIIGPALVQWDVGRVVRIDGIEADSVHLANRGDSRAVIMEIVDGQAKIPDYLLQTGKPVCVYAVKDGITIYGKTFHVQNRERPENYVYEDDQRNYIYELISKAEDAADRANDAADRANDAADRIPEVFVKSVNDTYPDENGNVVVAVGGDSNVVVVTYDKSTMKASMTGTEIYEAIKSGKSVVLNDGYSQRLMQFVESQSGKAVVCSTGLMPVVKGDVWNGTFEVVSETTDILFVDEDGNGIKKNSSVTVPTPTYLDDNKVLVAVGDYYGSTKWVDPSTLPGGGGKDGVSATHEWNGTVLTITSASGTSSADLKGDKGDTGAQGIQGEKGDKGDTGATPHIGANGNWWIGERDTGVSAGGSVGNSDIIYVTIDWDTMKASMTSHEIMEAMQNGKMVAYKDEGTAAFVNIHFLEDGISGLSIHAYFMIFSPHLRDVGMTNVAIDSVIIDNTGAVTLGSDSGEQIVGVPHAGTIWDVGKVLTVTEDLTTKWVDPSTIPALKGDKGDPGEKGEQGEQGPKGDKGDQGIQGEKGETGEAGAKGDKGDPGTNGTDGKTPVKGTDYWTDADKTEMVNDVLAALPTWTGGSY